MSLTKSQINQSMEEGNRLAWESLKPELTKLDLKQSADRESMERGMRERAGYADSMVAALKRQIDPLIQDLKPDEEIGALLTSFGITLSIRVTTVGHEDPHLIIIKGIVDDADEEVTLFQHVSQVNILFKKVKVKPGKRAHRIGFV